MKRWGTYSGLPRSGGLRPENLGQNALAMIGNLCFTLFVLGVLIFTIIAATYQPEDPLFHPSTKITNFLVSTSNATFRSDESVLKTGEDFMSSNQTAFAAFINVTDVLVINVSAISEAHCDSFAPIDCTDSDLFHEMMRATIEQFKDIHFYKFGKPVRGSNDSSCDMAWRFRPKEGKRAAFYKDYRRFVISRTENCTYTVDGVGEYHSGVNARKKKKQAKHGSDGGFEPKGVDSSAVAVTKLPVVGDAVNDTVPVVESESTFSSGKYLIYNGGGDRCKSMNHFQWSFLCSLGEAQYLNRTLVMDLSMCLSSMYTSSHQDEEGKDFRYYFDFEHLRESASVLEQSQFWTEWGKWQKQDGLSLHLVEDFRVTPMQLADIKDTLIMRKFGTVEPDNYWYRVCEGETESIIQRPWHLVWKSRRLLEIVSAISSKLNWDFDSVHVVRGEKAKNTELWPHLAGDTMPEAIISSLRDKVDDGRDLYIATDEPDTSFFDPLKDKYRIHFLDDYSELWGEQSEWYSEMKAINNGNPIEFDGYMRVEVDTEVFLRGKKQIETFNDLTKDCKDGINTCPATS
ncbi:hypothetical protein EJ110_NYTH45643 [Nymphaea thermarum]|nr:hypothetical protein EJ110_NYTH45643 [Nymphaea thermarum]